MSLAATDSYDPDPDPSTGSRVAQPDGKLIRLPAAAAAPSRRILAVGFRSRDGRRWHAIGGGATVGAAIAYARESTPTGTTWYAVDWNDLYGE